MPLTQSQRIQISGDQVDIPLKIAAANSTATQIGIAKTQLQNTDSGIKIFFDMYNTQINSYQSERQAFDGTTYSQIVEQDLVNSAQRAPSNLFFPTSWTKFQPTKIPSVEGLPTTVITNNEQVNMPPITTLINLLVNGQTSVVADDTLASDYISGSGSMVVTTGGQTVGDYLLISSLPHSGLFKITAITSTVNLTVTEIVTPSGNLLSGSTVKDNFVGFTNSERNTLTSTLYQEVIVGLSNKIITAITPWQTNLNSELTYLTANTDNRSPQASEILTAKNNVNTALLVISTWLSLPNTGTSGSDSKFTDVQLATITNQISTRTSFFSTRATQIATALGSVTQNTDGTYSGSGVYFLRFAQIDSRINLIGGPLTEFYEKGNATTALSQISVTATTTLNTYNTQLKTQPLSRDASGTNTVTVSDTSGFSNSDNIFIMADGLTELSGTINSISGNNIVLSITVPNTYTKALRARIYKQL